ncbi:integrase core domain-containing protein [Apiospora saccharicola]
MSEHNGVVPHPLSNGHFLSSPDLKAEFQRHIQENPSNRRVSPTEKSELVQWLTDASVRPLSQKEFSRRNYVRKSFSLVEITGDLRAVAKNESEKDRIVITTDAIVDLVKLVHMNNKHGGWDSTWKDVSSSYYGILRADVVFLLKRCEVCAEDPRKRPKGAGSGNTTAVSNPTSRLLTIDDLLYDDLTAEGTQVRHEQE